MSLRRKITLILVVFFLIVFCLKGWLFRSCFSYSDSGKRGSNVLISEDLRQYADSIAASETPTDVMDVVMLANEITSEHLMFRSTSNEINPNTLFTYRRTHCVGYAAFFQVVCNYLLVKFNFDNEWSCSAHVGRIYFMTMDVHRFFKSPFFKDHDFNIIRKKSENEAIYVDATLYDYFGIATVTPSEFNQE
ncbi:MAG: hypothetical protein ACKOZM_07920 [Flavobacteriales bacterium]